MQMYDVIFGMGGIAYGGYHSSIVIAKQESNIQGLLNEQHGEEVLISSVNVVKEGLIGQKERVVQTTEI